MLQKPREEPEVIEIENPNQADFVREKIFHIPEPIMTFEKKAQTVKKSSEK